jgi:hypothetical protein
VLKTHKIPDTALEEVELFYEARMAQRDEDKRVSFADFFGPEGEARQSVLFAGYFTDAASTAGGSNPSRAGTAAGAASSGTAGAGSVGNSNAGAAPPGNARGRSATSADLEKYFASPEYKALPPADKRKKLAELQASAAAPGLNGPGSPV